MYTWIVTTHTGNEVRVAAEDWATASGALLLNAAGGTVALFAEGKWLSCVREDFLEG